MSPGAPPKPTPWRAAGPAATRAGLVAVLLAGYWMSFAPAHAVVGNAAFVLAFVPCLTAAALLGVRGAVASVLIVVLLDRSLALSLDDPALSRSAAVAPALFKLLLAGGVGLAVDARRRLGVAHARLLEEVEARNRSEASLQRSEALHRALVESLGEGVGLFDARDCVVFANEALARTLQYPREALVGKHLTELLVVETREELERDPGSMRSYDALLRSNPSTPLLITETTLAWGDAGDALTLRVIRDLTERVVSERRQRDLERELQRSQALQSLAVLAGGVAHDFNNLLSGVVGNAELAERKLSRDVSPQLRTCLAEIKSFAGEAAQLSRQMLAYAGRRSLAIEAVDANHEIADALRLLHATIESKAQLVLDLTADLPEIAADRFQFRQVITNLVLNALEAMPKQRGRLTIHTESSRVEAQSADRPEVHPGHYVRIAVTDTGTGIPVDALDHIFDPFFSTKSTGRGMGLAAAVGIVRAHRGWLGVENVSESGTTFGVLLPAARETTPRRSSVASQTLPAPGPRTILLIDDEPAVRLVTTRLLAELGHRVLTADSGSRGLDLFARSSASIDLVLLDLTMPELSGEQVLTQLRRLHGGVRVVVTSGFHAADASGLLGSPNVIGFLEKPHTLTNLEMLLASVPRETAEVAPARSPDRHPSGEGRSLVAD